MVKLSVIIPIFNCENYLNRCLDSLCSDYWESLEIILVNDGSTDNSLIICESYAKKYANIHIISQTNGGVSRARNAGLDLAKGEYIFFLDSDDYVGDDFKEIILQCIRLNPSIAILRRWYLYRNSEEFDYSHYFSNMNSISPGIYKCDNIDNVLINKMCCSGSGEVLFKRKLAENIRFDVNRSILEDYDFFLKIFSKVMYFIFVDRFTTIINDFVPNSLTRKRITLEDKTYLSEYHSYFVERPKLRKRVYWLENYFDIKRYCLKDRIRHFHKNLSSHFRNFQLNKYCLGYLCFVIGIDINKAKQKLNFS